MGMPLTHLASALSLAVILGAVWAACLAGDGEVLAVWAYRDVLPLLGGLRVFLVRQLG